MDEEIWCQDHVWRPLFKGKCFKSLSVSVPNRVLDYLLLDSVIVDPSEDDPESSQALNSEEFKEFQDRVQDAIKHFGSVVARMNWSTAKDAEWMQSMCCKTVREVLILFKSSYKIAADLEAVKELGLEGRFNFSKFHRMKEGMNFRVFARDGKVIGASQKDVSSYYEFLEGMSQVVKDKVFESFEDVKELCPFSRIVYDIYIDLPPRFRVYFLGFSKFGKTDSALFDWPFLEKSEEFELRLVNNSNIRPSEYAGFALPIEITQNQDISEFINTLAP